MSQGTCEAFGAVLLSEPPRAVRGGKQDSETRSAMARWLHGATVRSETAMQELPLGGCPLHGQAVALGCVWCSLRDRALIQQQIHGLLVAHLLATDASAVLLSMIPLGHVGDALVVDATVSGVGHSLQARRYLVRPDSVQPLD
jgi:hypothetical protein